MLHGSERSPRLLFLSILFSITLHGVFVVVFFFLSTYTPRNTIFAQSVINVSMVSLPSDSEPAGGAPPAEPEPAQADEIADPPLVTAQESEVEAVPEKPAPSAEVPEPIEPDPVEAPEPEPVTPPTPREQVVIADAPEEIVSPEASDQDAAQPEQPPARPIRIKRPLPETRKPEKTTAKVVEPEAVRTESIKEAISRVREKVAKEIARKGVEKPVAGAGSAGSPGRPGKGLATGGVPGAISDIYRAQLTYQIEKNWAFPEHLADARKDLVTVIVVNILPSGHIQDVWFKERSGNSYLDDSAQRAVMKSNPLPPLPQGYNAYTVALVFTPSGLN